MQKRIITIDFNKCGMLILNNIFRKKFCTAGSSGRIKFFICFKRTLISNRWLLSPPLGGYYWFRLRWNSAVPLFMIASLIGLFTSFHPLTYYFPPVFEYIFVLSPYSHFLVLKNNNFLPHNSYFPIWIKYSVCLPNNIKVPFLFLDMT